MRYKLRSLCAGSWLLNNDEGVVTGQLRVAVRQRMGHAVQLWQV
jgi:hypothetical protein